MKEPNLYIEQLTQFGMEYGPRIIIGLLILLIGFSVINKLVNIIKTGLESKDFDERFTSALSSFTNYGLKILLLSVVISVAGLNSDYLLGFLLGSGFNIALAIAVLVVGLIVIRQIASFVSGVLEKRGVDESLVPFLSNLTAWTLRVLLFISVAEMVGVETTSFVAILGAAGLAIGLALKNNLANFAGGVMILTFKPFKVGDWIESNDHAGAVNKIGVFSTNITTADNKQIILPNGPLSEGAIRNFTTNDKRRVDLKIGIGYNDDIKKAIEVLTNMCSKHPMVLDDPAPPFVGVLEYADSSINLVLRSWTLTENYWTVFFELNQQIKYTLDENKISIPFPQRDVNLYNKQ